VGTFNLPTNGKTLEDKITIIIHAKNARTLKMLESQESIIVALTKGSGQAQFIEREEDVPQGCGSEIVSSEVNVHIPVKVGHFY
jgi:valyl-tRNA synthetase